MISDGRVTIPGFYEGVEETPAGHSENVARALA